MPCNTERMGPSDFSISLAWAGSEGTVLILLVGSGVPWPIAIACTYFTPQFAYSTQEAVITERSGLGRVT